MIQSAASHRILPELACSTQLRLIQTQSPQSNDPWILQHKQAPRQTYKQYLPRMSHYLQSKIRRDPYRSFQYLPQRTPPNTRMDPADSLCSILTSHQCLVWAKPPNYRFPMDACDTRCHPNSPDTPTPHSHSRTRPAYRHTPLSGLMLLSLSNGRKPHTSELNRFLLQSVLYCRQGDNPNLTSPNPEYSQGESWCLETTYPLIQHILLHLRPRPN